MGTQRLVLIALAGAALFGALAGFSGGYAASALHAGPRGPAGPQGAAGSDGAQGPRGLPGPAGQNADLVTLKLSCTTEVVGDNGGVHINEVVVAVEPQYDYFSPGPAKIVGYIAKYGSLTTTCALR